MKKDVLVINDLNISFNINDVDYPAIRGISLNIKEGEIVGIVGESGCGKTLTASAAIGLITKSAKTTGKVLIKDKNMLNASDKQWEELRGDDVTMIFQEPMTALNPLMKIGTQVIEIIPDYKKDKESAKKKVIDILNLVGLADSEKLYHSYPHQLSGGMRQRVMIAISLVNNPDLLIADEATTALDVTIQAQIMDILKDLNKKTNTAVMLISHDLSVIKNITDRVYIMYAGKIVEKGSTKAILSSPKHPYTQGLLNSIPDKSKKGQKLFTIKGYVPSLEKRNFTGCVFYDRCDKRSLECKEKDPEFSVLDNQEVACLLYKE